MTGKVTGYSLMQTINIKSTEVEKVSKIARESTELINQGIFIESGSPQYLYTKLGDLKVEMLAEAAKDAKEAEELLKHRRQYRLGKNGRNGRTQITPADSNEISDYGMNDTSSFEKDITAVVNISFAIN